MKKSPPWLYCAIRMADADSVNGSYFGCAMVSARARLYCVSGDYFVLAVRGKAFNQFRHFGLAVAFACGGMKEAVDKAEALTALNALAEKRVRQAPPRFEKCADCGGTRRCSACKGSGLAQKVPDALLCSGCRAEGADLGPCHNGHEGLCWTCRARHRRHGC